MPERTRCFIAVPFDDPTQGHLARIADPIKTSSADVRWVRRENLHLTMRFLGELPSKKLRRVTETMPGWVSGLPSFPIRFGDLGAFPSPKRPRVLWIRVLEETGRLDETFRALEKGLGRLGFRKDPKAFLPHVTIGRVRRPGGLADLIERLVSSPNRIPPAVAEEVVLYKSTLTSGGSIYEPIVRAPFGGPSNEATIRPAEPPPA